jgi:hypothetical protein
MGNNSTPPPADDDGRAAFEQWQSEKRPPRHTRRSENGKYIDPWAQNDWEAWQAARTLARPVWSVAYTREELRSLMGYIIDLAKQSAEVSGGNGALDTLVNIASSVRDRVPSRDARPAADQAAVPAGWEVHSVFDMAVLRSPDGRTGQFKLMKLGTTSADSRKFLHDFAAALGGA